MEDWTIGVLSVLLGVVGFFVGQRLSHKNETLAKQARWYEDELGNMRAEIKRYRAKASYYQKGAVPSELANQDSPEGLIDGILASLPQNLRPMVTPFRAEILKHAKENPEVVEGIIQAVKQKLGGKEQQQVEQIDML